MRVTKLTAPMTFETAEAPTPAVPAKGILIETAICGFTDRDIKAYFGEAASENGILGGQAAGTVIAVDEGNADYAVGDRVLVSRYISCGHCRYCRAGKSNLCIDRRELGDRLPGGLAQYMAIDAEMLEYGCVAKLPKNLKFEEVSGADTTAAVFHAQRCSSIAPGQKILVLGCGPAGCMHTHIAKLRGADTIVQADVVSSRVEMSRPFMAEYLLDLTHENLDDAVREATGGKGVDVAIVAASDPAAMALAIQQTAAGGKILLFSRFGEKGTAVPLDLAVLQKKQLRIESYDGYDAEDVREVLWLAGKRKINLKWMVTSVIDAAELPKKLEAVRSGKELRIAVRP